MARPPEPPTAGGCPGSERAPAPSQPGAAAGCRRHSGSRAGAAKRHLPRARRLPANRTLLFFGFHYTIESDETSLGMVTVCLNASARNVVRQPDFLSKAVKDDLEEDPQPAIFRDELAQLFPIALRGVQPEIRRLAAGIEQSSNRRLGRDTERIDAYYKDLLSQLGKRIARRGA